MSEWTLVTDPDQVNEADLDTTMLRVVGTYGEGKTLREWSTLYVTDTPLLQVLQFTGKRFEIRSLAEEG